MNKRVGLPVGVLSGALMLAGVFAAPAASAGIVVNCPTDSLQAAINAAAPGSSIEVSGTCPGPFAFTKDLTIHGQGAVLDGGGPVVTVGVPASTGPTVVLVLTGVTIEHGNASVPGGGGIILDQAFDTVILKDSTVTANFDGEGGGGIANFGGTVILEDSTVSANGADGAGGAGIFNMEGTVTLKDSAVSGNTAQAAGGGIQNAGGTVILENSTVSGNTAYFGGGIAANLGGVTLKDSEVSGNTPDNCSPAGSIAGCGG